MTGERGGAVGWGTELQAETSRAVFGFLADLSFRPYYGPGIDSALNRNEYQGYLLGLKATGA